jgi:hypothetical protein
VILAVHRSTVWNMMSDGRLTSEHLGGSKLRVVFSSQILGMIVGEIEESLTSDDMGHCPQDVADDVRARLMCTHDQGYAQI